MSLLSRMRSFWANNGVMFAGARDVYETYGWNRRPTHNDYVLRYWTQDIAKRVVNAPVNALWSDPPTIGGDAAFEDAWRTLLKTIPVFYNIQRVDKLAGLGRFAIMIVGFDDGRPLSSPVVAKPDRKVLYLQPYSEGSVQINDYEQDNTSPRFGLPTMYTVSPGRFDGGSSEGVNKLQTLNSFKVHWTRVLHVAEDALETPVFGHSRLQNVYNLLDDLLKVTGGSAETFWLTSNRGLHVNIDKDMELDEGSEEALSAEIDEYQHNLRRVLRTRGVDVASLGSEVADPRGIFNVLLSLLAAATGIPQRILVGAEAGQLASQQDRANWAQRLSERIAEYAEPVIILPFIRLLIDAGVLPAPTTFKIEWPDAFKMNPLERAQTSAQMARSAANLAKMLSTVEQINQSIATASRDTIVSSAAGDTTIPALLPQRSSIELLTPEECRSIIGFGKHAPVFDDRNLENPAAVG